MAEGAGRTFRIFVSSTFSDLKAERNALQERVFPRLRELCLAHGARFQAIDLRWGVSQEAARDQQTMNVCLREVARCQRVTPRPNFIVLLGDRYGWCPPPPQIPAEEFEQILEHVAEEGAALLDEWYHRDDNAVPPEYCLQPWTGSYDEWAPVEARLHEILGQAAEALEFGEEARLKYVASATHQEIAAGALQVEDADEHVFAFFRKIDGLPQAFAAGDFLSTLAQRAQEACPEEVAHPAARECLAEIRQLPPDATAREIGERIKALLAKVEEGSATERLLQAIQGWLYDRVGKAFQNLDEEMSRPDAEARERLQRLKVELRQKLLGSVYDYEAEWTGSSATEDHIDPLCDDVYESLAEVIQQQLAGLKTVDSLEAEIEAHEAFAAERAEGFLGRAEPLAAIEAYLRQEDTRPLLVVGPAGSGKSALLARALALAHEAHSRAAIVGRFVGATPDSSNVRALLESLCREITRRYGADAATVPTTYGELLREFPRRLALATRRQPLILFLDALDQLAGADAARYRAWLPTELPEHVRLVVSTLPTDGDQALPARLPRERVVEVPPMPMEEAKALLDKWLEQANRTLQPEQRQEVLTKFAACPRPFYLKLAFAEVCRWKSYDKVPKGARGCPGLGDGIVGIIRGLLGRLSAEANHGELLVSRSLGYLTAAKNGLTEDELLDLLSRDVDVYAWFLTNLYHTPPDLLKHAEQYLRQTPSARLMEEQDKPINQAATEQWLKRLCKDKNGGKLRDFLSTVLTEGDGLRLPVVLWSRLYFDLEPYLTQRAADGTILLGFYHRQVEAVVTEDYLEDEAGRQRHRALSRYFHHQPLSGHEDGARSHNLRKLSELPYQQAHGRLWEDLQTTLTDLDFLYAKTAAVGPEPLIDDYDEASRAGYQRPDLPLVQGALRLSAHVLTQDDRQLGGQLLGRLITQEAPGIQTLLEQAKGWRGAPWLRPLAPALTQSGDPLQRTLRGHGGAVLSLALDPAGRRLTAGCLDRSLYVWDLDRFELVDWVQLPRSFDSVIPGKYDQRAEAHLAGLQGGLTLKGYEFGASSITVLPDGRHLLLSIGRDESLWVWDMWDEKQSHVLRGHRGMVTDVAVTPDGAYAVSGGVDGTVRVWNLRERRERVLAPRHTLVRHGHQVTCVAVTADGRHAVSGSKDKTIRVWEIDAGQLLRTIHTGAQLARVAVTPDAHTIVSATSDGRLQMWEFGRGVSKVKALLGRGMMHDLDGHPAGVAALVVTSNGRRAISAGQRGSLKVWDIRQGTCVFDLTSDLQGPDLVTGMAVTTDGRHALTGATDRTIRVWKVDAMGTGAQRTHAAGPVRSLALTPGGRVAVSGALDGTVGVWDVGTNTLLHTLEGHDGPVRAVAVTRDGRIGVSVGHDKTVRVWDLTFGGPVSCLTGHHQEVYAVAVSDDGRYALSGSGDGTIRVWDLEAAKEVACLTDHEGSVSALALTADGTRALSAGADGTLRLWNLRHVVRAADAPSLIAALLFSATDAHSEEQEMRVLARRTGVINALAMTPRGEMALTGGREGTLQVWDLEKVRKGSTLASTGPAVLSLSITRDGDPLCLCARGRQVEMWNVREEKVVAAFAGDADFIACATTADGTLSVASDTRGRLHIFRLIAGTSIGGAS